MFVRFKSNWKWAEQGIYIKCFSKDKQYLRSDKCSETEILPEAADLAIDLGVADEVKEELLVPEPTADISEKKTLKKKYSGKSKKTGKKKRQ